MEKNFHAVQGMWWQTGTADPQISALRGSDGKDGVIGDWSAELLQLATQQRMNTDVRRTVFCMIMGSEDYVEASERLLRLPLKVLSSLHCIISSSMQEVCPEIIRPVEIWLPSYHRSCILSKRL